MTDGLTPRHRRAEKPRPRARRRGAPAVPPGAAEPRDGAVRLQKVLAAAGLGSRRSSEALLRAGRVSVNGRVASLGDSADPQRDEIAVDGQRLAREPLAYWMVHKPAGVVTTVRDPEGRPTVMQLLPEGVPHLHPVGRLDYASTGLVVLTNDGALTQALLHPSRQSEREYRVSVRGELDPKRQRALERGVVLEEGRTAPARISRVQFDPSSDSTSFQIVLTEGRNRQIRRSLALLGRPVKQLVRVRMGTLKLGNLKRGEARALRRGEIRELLAQAAQPIPPRSGGRSRGQGAARRKPAPAKAPPKPAFRRGERAPD